MVHHRRADKTSRISAAPETEKRTTSGVELSLCRNEVNNKLLRRNRSRNVSYPHTLGQSLGKGRASAPAGYGCKREDGALGGQLPEPVALKAEQARQRKSAARAALSQVPGPVCGRLYPGHADRGLARADETELARGAARQVEHAALDEGATVVDAHHDAFAVVFVGDLDPRGRRAGCDAQRSGRRGSCARRMRSWSEGHTRKHGRTGWRRRRRTRRRQGRLRR